MIGAWSIWSLLCDGRLDANLLFFYGLVVLTVMASLVLGRTLHSGKGWLGRWARLPGLEGIGEEAMRRARRVLVRLTWGAAAGIAIIGLSFHGAGGDVRSLVGGWLEHTTALDVCRAGFAAGAVAGLGVAAWLGVRLLRRCRPLLQRHILQRVGRPGNEQALQRWCALLERYAIALVRLLALWGALYLIGLEELADATIGFVLRVLTILSLARLLILACRALSRTLADAGGRHLSQGRFRHYWDRITRLFPFGERCFEAVVHVTAASLCVRELHFIAFVADFGPRIVQCIGILFGTRVLIELSQVLLYEAFGLYDEEPQVDQKGRTLVPLLQSCCQYVLYFGSAVIMLGVLGVDTRPILAGAGILGLAVGLGAQSLVTDVVSGFFILFENQYLVGDFVQIGDACGTVEAVGIRMTQIRDAQGKLYIIPNGQIKGVVNYSKGYVNAVVDVRVSSGSDLEGVFRAMSEAGRRLRQTRKEVLAETQIHGLVELGTSEMTVRAVTKVQPGRHVLMENEYRRLLKQVFDEKQTPERMSLAA